MESPIFRLVKAHHLKDTTYMKHKIVHGTQHTPLNIRKQNDHNMDLATKEELSIYMSASIRESLLRMGTMSFESKELGHVS